MDNPTSYHSAKRNLPLTGIVLSILVIVGILGLTYFKILPSPKTSTNQNQSASTRLTPKPILSQELSFQGCDIKKQNNPLVQEVTKIDDRIFGTFYGNINKIDFDKQATNSANIQIIAPKGDQTYTFNIKDEPNLVNDAVTLKSLKLSNLKPGLTVTVGFNCYPKNNNLFRISQIAIMGDTAKK